MERRAIAILGATSQLALDFIETAAALGHFQLRPFARRPNVAAAELARRGVRIAVEPLEGFASQAHDAIVNFVGVGDPAKAGALGAGIFTATQQWDEAALEYVAARPQTRYVFLSSGAIYGDSYSAPVTAGSAAVFPVNHLSAENWYGLAKLAAEARHRSRPELSIIDVRIFNYFSWSSDIAARFLITDMIRCARAGITFETTESEMVRDYLEPTGLYRLLAACLNAEPGCNLPVDAYTRAPLSKRELLRLFVEEIGLQYRFATQVAITAPTGTKPFYYSLNRQAASLGYEPPFTSSEGIVEQLRKMPDGPRVPR